MKGTPRWGEATNGPDWTDFENGVRALDAIHSGRTSLTISAVGAGATGGLRLVMITHFDALPGGSQFETVLSESEWPCKNCSSLIMHVMGGLYRHDARIEQAYEQLKLPKA